MSQHEFVLVYVAVPLLVALGWLLWRARYFLRNAVLYALAVASLLAVIRLGHIAWDVLERVGAPAGEEAIVPVCLDAPQRLSGGGTGSCWM